MIRTFWRATCIPRISIRSCREPPPGPLRQCPVLWRCRPEEEENDACWCVPTKPISTALIKLKPLHRVPVPSPLAGEGEKSSTKGLQNFLSCSVETHAVCRASPHFCPARLFQLCRSHH